MLNPLFAGAAAAAAAIWSLTALPGAADAEAAKPAAPAVVAAPGTAPVQLGVNTHFGQGWPPSRWPLLTRSDAPVVRDGLRWPLIEPTPGRIDLSPTKIAHIDRLCDRGIRVILGTGLTHPGYDAGKTVHSPTGRAALARYLARVAERFKTCLAAIEVGNEINLKPNITGPAAVDPVQSYVAILRAVYPQVKAAAPNVAVLGGSVNVVGTGFLTDLAEAGMLDVVDGVAVHPYRQDPTNVDWELRRLQAALDAHGPHRPIWATEFSRDFPDPAAAPDFLAKMVTLMGSVGVVQQTWYALVDQPGFPTMGLYQTDTDEKPVGKAFRYWQGLLPRGAPVRQSGDPLLFHYRFGADRQIVWGSPRSVRIIGALTARNSRGEIIPAPARIDETPVIFEGAGQLQFGTSPVLADSLAEYGRAPWTYIGQKGAGPLLPLGVTDWRYTSFIAHPTLRPSAVNQLGLVTAGGGSSGIGLTVRYTAPEAGPLVAVACLTRRNTQGDGVILRISRNAAVVSTTLVTAPTNQISVPLTLRAGETVNFTIVPGKTGVGDQYLYRYRMIRPDSTAPAC